MNRFLIAIAFLFSTPALAEQAAPRERAVVMTEEEANSLIGLLDVATRAQGLQVAPFAVFMMNKIKSAPLITSKKEDEPKPEDQKP